MQCCAQRAPLGAFKAMTVKKLLLAMHPRPPVRLSRSILAPTTHAHLTAGVGG
jgi:hypothetical protein